MFIQEILEKYKCYKWMCEWQYAPIPMISSKIFDEIISDLEKIQDLFDKLE